VRSSPSASPSATENGARALFDAIERKTPQLVSWNGKGFDIPVPQHRALIHGCAARVSGRRATRTRRSASTLRQPYQTRHLDLMDQLAMFNQRNFRADRRRRAPGRVARKQGVAAPRCVPAYRRARSTAIRDYCEVDVVNTISPVPALPGGARPAHARALTTPSCALLRETSSAARAALAGVLSLWKS